MQDLFFKIISELRNVAQATKKATSGFKNKF